MPGTLVGGITLTDFVDVPQAPQIVNATTASAVLRLFRGRHTTASKAIPSGHSQRLLLADPLGAVVAMVRIAPDSTQVAFGIAHDVVICGAVEKPVDVIV